MYPSRLARHRANREPFDGCLVKLTQTFPIRSRPTCKLIRQTSSGAMVLSKPTIPLTVGIAHIGLWQKNLSCRHPYVTVDSYRFDSPQIQFVLDLNCSSMEEQADREKSSGKRKSLAIKGLSILLASMLRFLDRTTSSMTKINERKNVPHKRSFRCPVNIFNNIKKKLSHSPSSCDLEYAIELRFCEILTKGVT